MKYFPHEKNPLYSIFILLKHFFTIPILPFKINNFLIHLVYYV